MKTQTIIKTYAIFGPQKADFLSVSFRILAFISECVITSSKDSRERERDRAF